MDCRRRFARNRRNGCGLCDVHFCGGGTAAGAGGDLEQRMVPLSSYAVISYTENWIYVAFAAIGSWIGAYATITFLHRPPPGSPLSGPPVGAAPE
jgi:hypothetical protein